VDSSIEVVCENCGQSARMLKNSHVDASGKLLEWPRASVKPDGIYFAIVCPTCGEREQCLARPGDES
jgi:hypothetical protein